MEPEIRFVESQFQRVTVGERDVIVLSYDGCFSQEAINHIYGQVLSKFPGHKILFLEEGLKIGAMGESERIDSGEEKKA